MFQGRFDRERSMWRGAVAGVVGGLVASWVMNRFQAGLSKAAEASESEPESSSQGDQGQSSDSDENATVKAADGIARRAVGRRLTSREKAVAGPAVHYVFGSAVGAAYGALAEAMPMAARAWGLPFGAALWFGADEVAVPAFGLSKSPAAYPASTHASALAAHLVYAATADGVRRALRAVM